MSKTIDRDPEHVSEADAPILEVRDLTVQFAMDRGTSRVLDEASMDVHRNEILGVVGESGSGKSMFASALLDAVVSPGEASGEVLYRNGSGDVTNILEVEESKLKKFRWEEIAMVFQGAMSSFNPTMKIKGHFEETIRAHNIDLDEQMEHARELLRDLYLDPDRVLNSYPNELSGGMRQRALIALSLVLEPEVLVMDEPTAALDLLMQRSITSLLAKLKWEYDLTIVFITHDLPLVAGLADRLAVLYAFDFIEVGKSEYVIENAAHPYTRALIKSVPRRDAAVDDMTTIQGESPDPVNLPSGCSYHPRCPLSTQKCEQEEPGFHEVKEDHRATCFHWEQSEEAIPYAVSEGENNE